MSDRSRLTKMADAGSSWSDGSVTVEVPTSAATTETETAGPVLRLKLKNPKINKKVGWTTDTIDNEDMNKKKSKCCCVYKKPPTFGESSSDTDDECDHCHGHTEKKKKKKKPVSDPESQEQGT